MYIYMYIHGPSMLVPFERYAPKRVDQPLCSQSCCSFPLLPRHVFMAFARIVFLANGPNCFIGKCPSYFVGYCLLLICGTGHGLY